MTFHLKKSIIQEGSVCTCICLLCGSKNVQKSVFTDVTNPIIAMLTLNTLNLNISCFKNSVDLDQLASKKPADQDLHCFPLPL